MSSGPPELPLSGNRRFGVSPSFVEAAPWAPLYNPTGVDFVSQRVGNYQNSPQWFLLTDQVWLK